jgi:prepilin-type N-terminal cleavage/methylation domain-containing protein
MSGINKKAFTLIELLIVVAIIAILSAIAVPNFLEAQTRAKVSRVKSDFRTLNLALHAFFVDHNDFPPDITATWDTDFFSFIPLTTPLSYITTVPSNSPFDREISGGRGNYSYWRDDATVSRGLELWFHVMSTGPDRKADLTFPQLIPEFVIGRSGAFLNALYDPTNGTISSGDLHMTNRGISNL